MYIMFIITLIAVPNILSNFIGDHAQPWLHGGGSAALDDVISDFLECQEKTCALVPMHSLQERL